MADNVGLGEAIGLGTQLRADTSKPITQGLQFGMGMEMRKNAAEAKELQYQRQLEKAYRDKLIAIQGKGGFKTAVANKQLQPFFEALAAEGMSNNPYTQSQKILDFQEAKGELGDVDKLWQGVDNVLKNTKVFIPKEARSAIKIAQTDGDKDKLGEVLSKYTDYVVFNPDNGAIAINEAQTIDFSPTTAANSIGRTATDSKPTFDYFGNLTAVETVIPEKTVSTFVEGTMSNPSAIDQYKEKVDKERFAKKVAEVKKENPNTDGNITESMYEKEAAKRMFKDDIMNASGKQKFYQKVQPKDSKYDKEPITLSGGTYFRGKDATGMSIGETGFLPSVISGGAKVDHEAEKMYSSLFLPKKAEQQEIGAGGGVGLGINRRIVYDPASGEAKIAAVEGGTYENIRWADATWSKLTQADRQQIASDFKISVEDTDKIVSDVIKRGQVMEDRYQKELKKQKEKRGTPKTGGGALPAFVQSDFDNLKGATAKRDYNKTHTKNKTHATR